MPPLEDLLFGNPPRRPNQAALLRKRVFGSIPRWFPAGGMWIPDRLRRDV